MDNKEYRQVVSDVSITSSKEYNDFLYGWLVLHAHMEDQVYIWKGDFILSKMEQELGMTRKTLSKYLSFLVKEGLVVEEKERWVLPPLEEKGFWIDVEILQQIIDIKKRYAITIYIYLVQGYWMVRQHGSSNLPILLDNIKDQIGISKKTRSNNEIITGVLENLREVGLLNYWLWTNPKTNKSFYLLSGIGKTNYF